MEAICIDGIPNDGITKICLPEFVPLEVYEWSGDRDYYWVLGYESEPTSYDLLVWHKRRFIPLSQIDEAKRSAEHQHEAIIYAR